MSLAKPSTISAGVQHEEGGVPLPPSHAAKTQTSEHETHFPTELRCTERTRSALELCEVVSAPQTFVARRMTGMADLRSR